MAGSLTLTGKMVKMGNLNGSVVKQVFITAMQRIKLDGVGPVDNRPSTNKLHHFFEKRRRKKV